MKRILLVPAWVTMRLTKNQSRAFKIILMVLVLLTGLYTKEYRGEYQMVINNKIGGIFYVLFASILFSLFLGRLKFYWPVMLALGLTSILEFVQYLRIPVMMELANRKIFAYIFGNSFDAADFIYYIIGAVVAAVVLFVFELEKSRLNEISDHQSAVAGSIKRSAGEGNCPFRGVWGRPSH